MSHSSYRLQNALLKLFRQEKQKSEAAMVPANYPHNMRKQMEKFEEMKKETSTEPIVAYRVWSIEKVGGLPYLKSSVKSQFLWPYRKALEQDALHNRGIHAAKNGDRLLDLWAEYNAEVAGEVYLWGKVIEHTEGYLAEFAYPKRLFMSNEADVITAMQLEEEYGVPLSFREEFKRPAEPKDGMYQYFQYANLSQAATGTAMGVLAQQQQAQGNMSLYQQMVYGTSLANYNPFSKMP